MGRRAEGMSICPGAEPCPSPQRGDLRLVGIIPLVGDHELWERERERDGC